MLDLVFFSAVVLTFLLLSYHIDKIKFILNNLPEWCLVYIHLVNYHTKVSKFLPKVWIIILSPISLAYL